MKFKDFFEKTLKILGVRPSVGGLEISNSALRYARLEGNEWRLTTQKLPDGTVNDGEVTDSEALLNGLLELRKAVASKNRWEGKTSVIVSLSSRNIYTQVFSAPTARGESVENIIDLNMKMLSPLQPAELYMGWQIINEEKDKLRAEVSAGFVKKTIADAVISALDKAGFQPAALESKALALVRIFRFLGSDFDSSKSYLLIDVDDEGIEFLIVRSGELHFEYFEGWASIYSGAGEIKTEDFRNIMSKSLNQVANFYRQRWPDPISEIVLSAENENLKKEIGAVIKENFKFAVKPLTLKISEPLSPEWYAALGSGLRGLTPRRRDKEISLLGVSAEEEYRREQLNEFLKFWRVAIPLVCGLMLAALVLIDVFVIKVRRDLESSAGFASADPSIVAEMAKEKNDIDGFNKSLENIKRVRESRFDVQKPLGIVLDAASKNNVSVDRLSLSRENGASLYGHAPDQETIVLFKKSLESENSFENVDMPLSGIKPDSQGFSFSLSFVIRSPTSSAVF